MAALIDTSGQERGVLTPLFTTSDPSGTDWLDGLEPPSQLFGAASKAQASAAAGPTAPPETPPAAEESFQFHTDHPRDGFDHDFSQRSQPAAVSDFLSHPEPVAVASAPATAAPASPRARTPYGQPLRLASDEEPAPATSATTTPTPPTSPPAHSSQFDTEQHRTTMIQAALDQDSVDGMDLRTLIFDFGPFAGVERELRELSTHLLEPEIADALMSHLRQTLHDVVVVRPHLQKADIGQEGIDARLSALGEIVAALAKPSHPATALMTKLSAQKAEGVVAFGKAVQNTLRAEQQRLGFMRANLQPSTLGSTVFNGLRNMMKPGPTALVGNARRTRNAELLKAVHGLTDIASEIKANSGNADWERRLGPQSIKEAKRLRERVQNHTKGVEDQIDHRDLSRQLGKVKSILAEASAKSVDTDHKNRLDDLTNALAELVKNLADALGRMFGKEASSAAAPRP